MLISIIASVMELLGKDRDVSTVKLVVRTRSVTLIESEIEALVNPMLPIPVQFPPVNIAVPSVNVPPLIISVAVKLSDNDARIPVKLPVMLVVPKVAEEIMP